MSDFDHFDLDRQGNEHFDNHPGHGEPGAEQQSHEDPGGRSHRWLMLACCIPMVVIVAVLLVTGAAGSGAILFAAICVGLMALMMFAMPGGHDH